MTDFQKEHSPEDCRDPDNDQLKKKEWERPVLRTLDVRDTASGTVTSGPESTNSFS